MNQPNKPFHICTLVTDWDQYHKMKRSMVAAGFDPAHADFEAFDNTAGNCFEPYGLINRLMKSTPHLFLILCHQDVRADRGYGRLELESAIAELDALDPRWAVLGNAGCTDDFEFVLRVTDPNNFAMWSGRMPLRVNSLDENFLLIRTSTRVGTSPSMSGFHLYGTDICLNARLLGFRCYVVDFVLSHLSAGKFDSNFMKVRQEFITRWSSEFHAVWVIREAEIFLSRWSWMRRFGGKVRVKRMLRSMFLLRRCMTWQLRRKRGFAMHGSFL